jgi:hypothetical protein
MCNETVSSGKEGSAITAVLAGAAGFGMSFPVGLNSVSLGALVALPLLLSMLAAKVLLYASQVAQSARRVVMHTGGLRADIDALANLLAGPLPQLPGQVMAPSVQLQVLIPLKPFVTNLAHKSIGRHQCSRRQRYHLCLWVWSPRQVSLPLGSPRRLPAGYGGGCGGRRGRVGRRRQLLLRAVVVAICAISR